MEDDKDPAIACVYAMRGLLTINAGQLAVEEGEVRVYFDIRYPVTASGETVLARMRAAAAPYGLRVWKRHEMRPVYMDKNSRVIRSRLAAYREQTGDMGEPLVVGGGTYARAMKDIVAFGPAAREGRPPSTRPTSICRWRSCCVCAKFTAPRWKSSSTERNLLCYSSVYPPEGAARFRAPPLLDLRG